MLVGGSVLVAVVQTVSGKVEPAPRLRPERREPVAASIAAREPGLRARAQKQFPHDHWSQDDAFGALEQQVVRSAAARERADLGSVLDALDAYLHAHPSSTRKAGASPCKPRPFYD